MGVPRENRPAAPRDLSRGIPQQPHLAATDILAPSAPRSLPAAYGLSGLGNCPTLLDVTGPDHATMGAASPPPLAERGSWNRIWEMSLTSRIRLGTMIFSGTNTVSPG
jgi:hypothetical protein